MKRTYPICCGVDIHKDFLVATIVTSEYVIPHYHQKRFSTYYSGLIVFKACSLPVKLSTPAISERFNMSEDLEKKRMLSSAKKAVRLLVSLGVVPDGAISWNL